MSNTRIEGKDGSGYERVAVSSETGRYEGFIIVENAPKAFRPELQVTLNPLGVGVGRESHFILHCPEYARHLVAALRKCADMIEAKIPYLENE